MNFLRKTLYVSLLVVPAAFAQQADTWTSKAKNFATTWLLNPVKSNPVKATAAGVTAAGVAAYAFVPQVKTQVNKGLGWAKEQVKAGAEVVNKNVVSPVKAKFTKLDNTKLSRADGIILASTVAVAATAYADPAGIRTSAWNRIKGAAQWMSAKSQPAWQPVWKLVTKNKATKIGTAAAVVALPVVAYASYKAYKNAGKKSAAPTTVTAKVETTVNA